LGKNRLQLSVKTPKERAILQDTIMLEHLLQILLLGLVQGAAELLPVSSSAHVIVVEKLLGLDPSSPEWTFILVMLHTGTMFAVIVYFWNAWRREYFSSGAAFLTILRQVVLATICTAIVGLALLLIVEKVFLKGADIETLFAQLPLLGIALLITGFLIIVAGFREPGPREGRDISNSTACLVGAVQGVCIPFRGLSRSGATISTGLLAGVARMRMEVFSFALAVVITPPSIGRELLRLVKTHPEATKVSSLVSMALPGIIGMVASFIAGLLALRLLSSWLESGRWRFFGVYCIAFAVFVFALAAFRF
jgi:undecaprenyl-diphosphatase